MDFVNIKIVPQKNSPQQTGSRIAFTTFGINHSLPKNHILNFKYQITNISFQNIGLGAFDLSERGVNRTNIQHKFSLIEFGVFKGKYANDLTFDFTNGVEKVTPNSEDETILVLNAFNRGGAGTNNQTDKLKIPACR